MDAAFDGGVNFFDTADVYPVYKGRPGLSEKIIGSWLKTGRRPKVIIATKVGQRDGTDSGEQGLSWRNIQKSVDGSLRRLGVETIDLYQAHSEDENIPLEETFRAFEDIVRRGKVRYIGLSNYCAQSTREALGLKSKGSPRVECLQPNYNLLWRSEFEPELMEICREENLGVISYSPLARGYLTGKYMNSPVPADRIDSVSRYCTGANAGILKGVEIMARSKGCTMGQISLSWIISNPVVTSVIVGASAPGQLKESLRAVDVVLTGSEKKDLEMLSADNRSVCKGERQ